MNARIVLLVMVVLVPLAFADLCTTPQPLTSNLTSFGTNTTTIKSYYFVYKAPVGQKSVSLKFYPKQSAFWNLDAVILVSNDCSGNWNTLRQYWSSDSMLVLQPSYPLSTASTLYIAVNSSNSFSIQACSSGGASGHCTTICAKDCSGNGNCDVATGFCSCTYMYGGTDCATCTGCTAITTGASFLFGSLLICLVVVCVIPVLVVAAIIALIVSCCRSRRTHHHHTTIVSADHQPLLGAPGPYYPSPGFVAAQPGNYPPGTPYAPVNYYPQGATAPGQPYYPPPASVASTKV